MKAIKNLIITAGGLAFQSLALTKAEFDLIKKHPFRGYQTLKHSNRLVDITEIILHHYERWMGPKIGEAFLEIYKKNYNI